MENVNFQIEIKRAQFRAALIFAADKDIRYYLNSVCLHVGECGDARLVATDGHRMAVIQVCSESAAAPGEYLIPRDALKAIKKAGRYDAPLALKIAGDGFTISEQFEAGAILSGGKLVDGKFPDWRRVIPDPAAMSGAAGCYQASYLADIQKALIELGDKKGLFYMLQDGENGSGLVMQAGLGFLCVVMPLRKMATDTAEFVAAMPEFMPRIRPHAIIETATGKQDFPFDHFQNTNDKRRAPQLPPPPEFIILETEAPAADDAEYLEYLASLQPAPIEAAA